MLEWFVGFAFLLALASLVYARRLARRLEALNQSYWDLRYECSRLRAQVARLNPEQAAPAPAPETAPPAGFVPLSSLKKTSREGGGPARA